MFNEHFQQEPEPGLVGYSLMLQNLCCIPFWDQAENDSLNFISSSQNKANLPMLVVRSTTKINGNYNRDSTNQSLGWQCCSARHLRSTEAVNSDLVKRQRQTKKWKTFLQPTNQPCSISHRWVFHIDGYTEIDRNGKGDIRSLGHGLLHASCSA